MLEGEVLSHGTEEQPWYVLELAFWMSESAEGEKDRNLKRSLWIWETKSLCQGIVGLAKMEWSWLTPPLFTYAHFTVCHGYLLPLSTHTCKHTHRHTHTLHSAALATTFPLPHTRENTHTDTHIHTHSQCSPS